MSQSSSISAMKKGQTIGKYAVVAELGKRVPAIFAAHASAMGGEPELVVLEVVVAAEASAAANEAFVKRARRLAQARHPNICRIRDVVVTNDKIAIASDYVEGETLGELLALDAAAATRRFGLPEQLRILVDVLSGMSAIHLAPDLVGGPKDEAPPFHGAIHPRNIVVGADGSTRLVRIVRPPVADDDEGKSIEEATYAAPELLLGDTTAGARVDVYSVGVLLWEALSRAPLFSERDAKDVVARQLAGVLPRATPPAEIEWANALVDIAARALEVDPDKRFASTAELAGALRLAVQAKLAPASRVGAAVTALAHEKINERRTNLRPTPRGTAGKIFPPKTAPAIANPAKIADLKRNLGLSSEPDKNEIEAPPETKRFRMESLAEEDLQAGDDAAIDASWSNPPPAKKPSIAPPLKRPSIAPPIKKASMAPPLPTRAISVPPPPQPMPIAEHAMPMAIATPPIATPAPTSNPIAHAAAVSAPASHQYLETAPNVAAPYVETHAISAATTQRNDGSGAVVFPLEDPQRRKRIVIVIGMVAFAAVILLVAGIHHAASSPADDVVTTSASAKNSSSSPAQDPAPTATAVTTATSQPTATMTPIAAQIQATDTTPQTIDPSSTKPSTTTSKPATPHDGSQHTATPPKPTHKKPPRSSYEPEGI